MAYVYLKRVLGNHLSVLSIFAAISSVKDADQPPCKKQKALVGEADRAKKYQAKVQPGRMLLRRMGFVPFNRGGQGIIPRHTHTIAKDICKNCTSSRRYGAVLIVEVPEGVRAEWLSAQVRK